MQSSAPQMLWALDLGNTKLKLARFVDGNLREIHTYSRTAADKALAYLLEQEAHAFSLLSTGTGEELWIDALSQNAPVWRYAPGDPCPLEVTYGTPHTLGLDRLAAAVGAYSLYSGHDLLVIDAGTCITYERVTASGVYFGGNIAPGLHMRLNAMHHFTGKLPKVDLFLPEGQWGVDTATALQQGGIRGTILELQSVISTFKREFQGGIILLCGGDGPFLRPHLPAEVIHRPTVVLEGLAKLHTYAHTS